MGATDHDATGPRWRTRLAVLIGGIAAAIIVALVVVLNVSTGQRDRAIAWQQQSYEAMFLARSLDASMGRSEAMLGRFVISGDGAKDFGRIYFDYWRRAGAEIVALENQVSDSRSRALIAELKRAYATRGQELADVALRTNYGQNPQALSLFYAAGRSPQVQQIATLLKQIIENERRVLARRTAVAEARISSTNRIGTIFSIVGVLLIVGGGALATVLFQSFADRQNEAERSATLETAVAARTVELREAYDRLRIEMADREVAEARLRQAHKMDAIGQLTGGIAHDFNNMLAVVVGGVELAKRRWASGSGDVAHHLDSAMEGAARASALTRRLLGFARSEPLAPEPLDPRALIADMSTLLDRVIGDTILVRIEGECSPWPILADRHQLENAILNLAVNARDAMPTGGTLTLCTGNVTLTEGSVADAEPGDYVEIAVTDTGFGMPPEVVERIFEPFFTTKDASKGTGLGLSQIFGFVRQSGGTVAAVSEVDVGTTVSIYLPRHAGAPVAVERAEDAAGPQRPQPAPAHTLLVIEDDPRVLAATVETLEEIGHRVIACNEAAAAPAILAERPEVDLIISDVMMPGLTGPELIARIREDHPHLPVLFVTGYADVGSESAFAGHPVLRKPFTLKGLEDAVETALGTRVTARAA